MGTVKIKNLSTLANDEAIGRVMWYIQALTPSIRSAVICPYTGAHKVKITRRGNTYTVTDAEEVTEQ